MLASRELLKEKQNHSRQFSVNARRLAEFLQSVEAEEALLTQRLRDREGKATEAMRASHISSEEARVGEGPLSKEWLGPTE